MSVITVSEMHTFIVLGEICCTSWIKKRKNWQCSARLQKACTVKSERAAFCTIKDVIPFLPFKFSEIDGSSVCVFFIYIFIFSILLYTMAGVSSVDAVKRKIRSLQEQADGAEERAERLQKELLEYRKAREHVSVIHYP